MALPSRQKQSLVIVYTGEGKGKSSAGLGLISRALGHGSRVAFIQFIKHWRVGEDHFLESITPVYGDHLTHYKGGKGFYRAGELSAKNTTEDEHIASAKETLDFARACAMSGSYDVVVCDEINNAVHDGLLCVRDLKRLIDDRHPRTTLCLTGRNFPMMLESSADIISRIERIKHHYDEGFSANKGIDY